MVDLLVELVKWLFYLTQTPSSFKTFIAPLYKFFLEPPEFDYLFM